MARAIGPNCEQKIVGIRPGEKLHEEMITQTDALSTVELDRYYVILSATPKFSKEEYMTAHGGRPVPDGFHYSSDANDRWLSAEQLREEIRLHVDAGFTV